MPKNIRAILSLLFLLPLYSVPTMADAPTRLDLRQGWTLQSSRKIAAKGEAISAAGFQLRGWYRTTVPSTVLAAQVAAGEFLDPYFGMNLRKIPGMTYPIGLNNFNLLPMDQNSPYAVSWWYRTEFLLPPGYAGKTAWLHFNGINYRANIWLNGRKVADAGEVAGAYRIYEFNVTSFLNLGRENVLAVETFAPTEKDLGINWVDWNPAPPDKDMGLWGDVYLTTSGPVSVRYPQVITRLASNSGQEADLTNADVAIMAEVSNASAHPVRGMLEALLDQLPDQIRVRADVALAPGETRTVTFSPDQYSELKLKQPKLWWPAGMGTPTLHDLTVRFYTDDAVSDEQHRRVGLRRVTSEMTPQGYRLFRINGKRILIRGAGWSQDMLLRHDRRRLEDQFDYVRDMGLNAIRMEAQLEPDDFFDLADEKGILVMAGWCCCDIWERWDTWVPETLRVATQSLRTELLRLRSHPSMIAWLNGSDGPPPGPVERAYLQVEKEVAWPNVILSSAAQPATTVSGPSGVKMTGPYDYEPPSYWLQDPKKYGGAWGFNTETGPGPAVPVLDSLRKFIPKDHLWPIDAVWNYHSAGERFQTMDRFNEAMEKTYGKPAGLADYLKKAQAMAYDGERAMFEAYGKNKYTSTGVIQWMLNNAWPSTYWHLYDYYLEPGGGYFGTKKACEPLHVQYSYDDRSVVVVNSRQEPATGLTVTDRVYDTNLKELYTREEKLDIGADISKAAFAIPAFPEGAGGAVYFVELSLRSGAGKEISSNFYWLPAKLSTLAWDKTPDTAFTPIATFEDLTALNRLPAVRLQARVIAVRRTGREIVRVIIHNPSRQLAFQIHVGVRKVGSEDEILPVLWEDNYFSLLPGESKVITAQYPQRGALAHPATVSVDGWNIAPVSIPLITRTPAR